MQVTINDRPRELAGGTTLAAALAELGIIPSPGIAVAVNEEVVPRTGWEDRALTAGDRITVIRAVPGG